MKDDNLNRLKVARGSRLPHAKLTESDVSLIWQLIEHREQLKREAAQLTNAKIAEKFGVHVRTIDRVSAGENWTHVN